MKLLKIEPHSQKFETPLKTSQGVFHTRESLILHLEHAGTPTWGEIAPWIGFSCETLNFAKQCLETRPLNELEQAYQELPCTSHALSSAKFFAENPFPFPQENCEENSHFQNSAILIPRTKELLKKLKNAAQNLPNEKITIFKIKIGTNPIDEEILFCKELLEFAEKHGNIALRFDANGAWNQQDELKKITSLCQSPALDFIEQPLKANPKNDKLLFELPKEISQKIALDESLREPWNLPNNAPIIAIVKPALIGNFEKLRTWLKKPTGTQYVLSSVFESPIGKKTLNFLIQENKQNLRQLPPGLGVKAKLFNCDI